MDETITYLTGLGNYHESESLPHALIKGRNSPQKVPFGLYAEQLSGSAFTTPRHANLHTWFYRIRPSVKHGEFQLAPVTALQSAPFDLTNTPPNQLRWNPPTTSATSRHFIDSLFTIAGNGCLDTQTGAAIHLYDANRSMQDIYFYNADGELLIIPQSGRLHIKTECGHLTLAPGEISVIPRGIKFQVMLLDKTARGYVCENYGLPFRLPELGVIGANGLANQRDFLIPTSAYEDITGGFHLLAKFQGKIWQADIGYSPLDVVAWHGNYLPYKYNLTLFNVINSVSYDHTDPSIYTVLTSPSAIKHIANVDLVIFPPRWSVAQDTFRLPYFHRNIMSEYMGLISGSYDAKEAGFVPGGGSLHNCMTAHGPDADSYEKAINTELKPLYYDNGLAFMLESRHVWRVTSQAYHAPFRQKDYMDCWQGLETHFTTVA